LGGILFAGHPCQKSQAGEITVVNTTSTG